MKSIDFIFFGCWNRQGKNVAKVMRALEEDHKKNMYDMCIVAGDNVYPKDTGKKKKDEPKIYSLSTIKDGFKMLRDSVSEDVHMILGNHNVVSEAVFNEEKKTANKLNFEFYGRNNSFIDVSMGQGENMRILFINTNDTDETKLDAFLEKNINPKCAWNIVVGHDPILSIKHKFDKDTKMYNKKSAKILDIKGESNERYEVILQRLCLYENVVYMCADVHMFQAGYVHDKSTKQSVPMIVAGPGGASPDSYDKKLHVKTQGTYTFDKRYEYRVKYFGAPYGYCRVNVSTKCIQVEYVHADNQTFNQCFKIHLDGKTGQLKVDKQKCLGASPPTPPPGRARTPTS